jgi:hypothetical protein
MGRLTHLGLHIYKQEEGLHDLTPEAVNFTCLISALAPFLRDDVIKQPALGLGKGSQRPEAHGAIDRPLF